MFGMIVTYWPSTEPSIKRCDCVNRRCIRSKISEIILTCGRSWIRCRKQVNVKQFYNQMWQTAWVSSLRVSSRQWVSVSWSCRDKLGIRCRRENQFQTEDLGPQDPGWAAQQNEEEVLLWSEELGVNVWQSFSVSNSPLTHNQHQPFRNPFENKVREVYFSKKVCSFVIIVDYVSAWICILIVVSWLYNILLSPALHKGGAI